MRFDFESRPLPTRMQPAEFSGSLPLIPPELLPQSFYPEVGTIREARFDCLSPCGHSRITQLVFREPQGPNQIAVALHTMHARDHPSSECCSPIHRECLASSVVSSTRPPHKTRSRWRAPEKRVNGTDSSSVVG